MTEKRSISQNVSRAGYDLFSVIAALGAALIILFMLIAFFFMFTGDESSMISSFYVVGITVVVVILSGILAIMFSFGDPELGEFDIPPPSNSIPVMTSTHDPECNGTGRCRYCRGTGEAGWTGLVTNGLRCPICIGTGVCHKCQGTGVK